MSLSHLEKKSAAVDRISDLPDEILCHILSFLSTKNAFTTSVLSKRWTPLCRLRTALYFSDIAVKNDEEAFLRFRRFVDGVMLSPRMQHQPIKTFRLTCLSKLWDSDHFKVNEWVEAAKRHRVEVLRLDMYHMTKEGPSLAPSIFSSQTLVVLELSRLRVAGNILSVNLPLLKTLHLSMVHFQNQEDLKKLLFACPILEDLQTCIRYVEGGDVMPWAAGFNNLSKVVRASIHQFDVPFEAIYNVKFLRISRLEERLSYEDINFYYKCFPMFRNLICLELRFSCVVRRSNRIHGWDEVVWEVLQHCPILQILLIGKSTYASRFYTNIENWEYPNSVPECVSCHLRTCTIINYKGLKDDLRFTTYILKNARLLQVMTIKTINSESYSYPTEKAVEELSCISRISPGCKLVIQIKENSSLS